MYEFGKLRGVTKEEIEGLILNPNTVQFKIPNLTITKIEYLFDFAKMIWADGKVDDYERQTLKMFCKKFGFEEENINALSDYLLEQAHKKTPKMDFLKIAQENL